MGDERIASVHHVAVADAGPLIHLNEIGCLELLAIFDEIQICDEVWPETVGRERVLEDAILLSANIRRYSLIRSKVSEFIYGNQLEHLHEGEQVSLCLCKQNRVGVLLTDDLAVRDVDKRLGVLPVGSLGIVMRAYWLGKQTLSEAEQNLERLYQVSSLFVTRQIIEMASQALTQQRSV